MRGNYLLIGVGRQRIIGVDLMVEAFNAYGDAVNAAQMYVALNGKQARYFIVQADEVVASVYAVD